MGIGYSAYLVFLKITDSMGQTMDYPRSFYWMILVQ